MAQHGERLGTILIVDDNTDILTAAKLALKKHYQTIITNDDPMQILPILEANAVDVVLLDMNFSADAISGKEGFYWLKQILKQSDNCAVILMTAYSDIQLAVEAIKAGAADFISKPWQNEQLQAVVAAAYGHAIDKQKVSRLTRQTQGLSNALNQSIVGDQFAFLGQSPQMQAVFKTIEKAALTDANILITGESGTGKELAARAIHQASLRRDNTFVSFDMGSVANNLFESEFFGHKKGAFTDAKADKIGRFELAHNGTLFLDELGNLPIGQQPKLLAALQNRQITPVGGNKSIKVDIRLISATNDDLHQAVTDGYFRQDLLYRINTIEIRLPPLRERVEDIPLLADYYLQHFAQKYKRQLRLREQDLNSLMHYNWPGNVRELAHAIERAVILSDEQYLDISHIVPTSDNLKPTNPDAAEQTNSSLKLASPETFNLAVIEQHTVQAALKHYQGNVSQAAKALGLTRGAMYRRLEKYGL